MVDILFETIKRFRRTVVKSKEQRELNDKLFTCDINDCIFRKEKEVRIDILNRINKWNESGYMSDCLGCHWDDLIKIIKGIELDEVKN